MPKEQPITTVAKGTNARWGIGEDLEGEDLPCLCIDLDGEPWVIELSHEQAFNLLTTARITDSSGEPIKP